MNNKKGKKLAIFMLIVLLLLVIGIAAAVYIFNSKPALLSDDYTDYPPEVIINLNGKEYIPVKVTYKWDTGDKTITNEDPETNPFLKINSDKINELDGSNIKLDIVEHNKVTNPKFSSKVWYNEDESEQLEVNDDNSINLPSKLDKPAVLEIELTANEGSVQYLLYFDI